MHFHFHKGHFAKGREKVKLNKDAKNYFKIVLKSKMIYLKNSFPVEKTAMLGEQQCRSEGNLFLFFSYLA